MLVTLTLYLRLNVFICGMWTRDRAHALACCGLLQEELDYSDSSSKKLQELRLLGCDSVFVDKQFPTFRRNVLSSLSRTALLRVKDNVKIDGASTGRYRKHIKYVSSLGPHRWQDMFV